MAKEITIAREGSVKALNAQRGSARQAATAHQSYKRRLKQKRNTLVHSDSLPTSQSERIPYDNLYSGKLTKSSSAKKEFLNHAGSFGALDAAKEAWNNPLRLRKVRVSPLGEDKDMSNPQDVKNIEKKKKRGITNFNVYRMSHNGRRWIVKTAQYKKGYETLYFIG